MLRTYSPQGGLWSHAVAANAFPLTPARLVGDHAGMKPLRLWQTEEFKKWLGGLAPQTRKRIERRVGIAALGHFGDHHGVKGADEVSEMRLDFGPGYRIYYHVMADDLILLLLAGGDKSTQKRDIARAGKMLPGAVAGVKQALEEEKRHAQTGK